MEVVQERVFEERLLFGVQEHALKPNWIKKSIYKQHISKKYRMCGQRYELIIQ